MDGRTIALLIDSFWQILLPGLTVTIPLTAISFLFGLIIALFTALVQIAHVRVLDQLARFYVWVIRGTPLLVQLFVIFYGLPSLGVTLDAFPSAIIVFSINTGAYAAETMRAAILSVPKGQMEAGRSLGLNYLKTMWFVIAPQVLKNVLPTLANEFITLLKETSVAGYVAVSDLTFAGNRIRGVTYSPFMPLIAVAIIYLILVMFLTRMVGKLERRLRQGDNR